MSGAIKNQWGCIPDDMRIVYHPHFDDMILGINRLVRPRLALTDGTYFLDRSGPLAGDPVRMDLFIASDSIGAMDATLCNIMRLNALDIRYLAAARHKGWIPAPVDIGYNTPLLPFCNRKFRLRRTPRNWVVWWAFDRPWAIKLFWNSRFADLFHKVLYRVTGNPVQNEIKESQMGARETGGVAGGTNTHK